MYFGHVRIFSLDRSRLFELHGRIPQNPNFFSGRDKHPISTMESHTLTLSFPVKAENDLSEFNVMYQKFHKEYTYVGFY
jgi:hypothetical protein